MSEFIYRAIDARGGVQTGKIQAYGLAAAARQLRTQGLTPLELQPAEAVGVVEDLPPAASWTRWRVTHRRVRARDLSTWTSELSTMLRAGLPLDRCLRLLALMAPAAPLQSATEMLLSDIKAGQPLSRALARHPELFGEFFINLVRAGEATGQLAEALERIREHQERVRELREKAWTAATYPVILAAISVISLVVMLVYVVPQFRGLFGDLGDRLPLATQWVMSVSDALTRNPWLTTVSIVCVLLFILILARQQSVRRRVVQALHRWPVVGSLLTRYQQAVFVRTLGAMLNNGVGLVTALKIAGDTFVLPEFKKYIEDIAVEVKNGRRLADVMQRQVFFEPLVVNLVKVGEETGRLGPMWSEAASIIEREVQQRLQRLLALLEPALILVLGALIAGIILSILMGILAVNDLAAV
ncbi:Type II secretion system protein F [Tepidimonas alkaliphilus]|uniref:Type II secretion system protein F n=1 Tax=Tepidimonas alkaliphilus TaxID=2588942 RepID=A0A554W9D2_9BURK|nr:type II secretion system F family protein [Tepidimonas alkaliphilus]TSE20187.1 Type II secretion system protein F [Tepidimonas alkaliphilus]